MESFSQFLQRDLQILFYEDCSIPVYHVVLWVILRDYLVSIRSQCWLYFSNGYGCCWAVPRFDFVLPAEKVLLNRQQMISSTLLQVQIDFIMTSLQKFLAAIAAL